MQSCNYACIAVGAAGSTIYAAGSDGKLRELQDEDGGGLKCATEVALDCAISQLCLPTGGAASPFQHTRHVLRSCLRQSPGKY